MTQRDMAGHPYGHVQPLSYLHIGASSRSGLTEHTDDKKSLWRIQSQSPDSAQTAGERIK